MNKVELIKEREFLTKVIGLLHEKIETEQVKQAQAIADMHDVDNYIQDQMLDDVEICNNIVQSNNYIERSNIAKSNIYFMKRLLKRPYFGKIIVLDEDNKQQQSFYIGSRNITSNNEAIVLDWRAPVCSLYYEGNMGLNTIKTDLGLENFNLVGKRQFCIENGTLKYFIDSTEKIDDDFLTQVLSRNTDHHLRSIVESIQAEQNQIIRQREGTNLIIYGVAGSGKTSVAMHRIAYLLYAYKNKFASKNMLSITPNRLFGAYIGTLLPELGEEEIDSVDKKTFYFRFLPKIAVESKEQMIECMLASKERVKKVRESFTQEYFERVKEYLRSFNSPNFYPEMDMLDTTITKEDIKAAFVAKPSHNIYRTAHQVAENIVDKIFCTLSDVKQQNMVNTLATTYINEYDALKIAYGFFGKKKGDIINYEELDAFAFIFASITGIKADYTVKHVYVDEIQDYSPIAIDLILSHVPDATFTFVGDKCQNILFNSDNDEITAPLTKSYTLNKSFRSTEQIMNYAVAKCNKMVQLQMFRKGQPVEEIAAATTQERVNIISEHVSKFLSSGYGKVAVITKTAEEAVSIAAATGIAPIISPDGLDYFLNKAIIAPAYLVKGLEFDCVIVANEGAFNVKNEQDLQLLYVALTRPLHRLIVIK